MEQNNYNKPVPLEGQTGDLSVHNFDKIISALPLEQRMAFERERAERHQELAAEYPHLAAQLTKAQANKQAGKGRRRQRGRQVPNARAKYSAALQRTYLRLSQEVTRAVRVIWKGGVRMGQSVAWATRSFITVASSVYQLALHHILSPLLCFACILLGVCLSALLPASLWVGLALPPITQWVGPPLSSFPLTQIPELATWFVILLVSLPIAVVVFREGAFTGWRSSTDPLLARMLYTVAAGIRWPKVWFRRRQTPASSPATP